MKITHSVAEPVWVPKTITIQMDTQREVELMQHLVGCWNTASHCSDADEVRELARKIDDTLDQCV